MSDRRLTSAEYEEMADNYAADPITADEIESVEIDPAYLRNGRPTKGAGKGKTPVLAIRLPEPLRVEVEYRVKAGESNSISELVRRAVVEYLDRHPTVPIASTHTETLEAEGDFVITNRNEANSRHVVPNSVRGGWDVKNPDSPRASAHFETQAEAVNQARFILKISGGGELNTHDRHGKIRAKDTITPGNDPYPPRV
jgi:Arc/MetJ-type ribon-helix-helix transcriptional regulator